MSAALQSLAPASFSPKEPWERVYLAFDFGPLLAAGVTLSAPSVTCSVSNGTDAMPQAMLDGSPTLDASRVVQRVTAGVAGVDYRLRAQVDASDGSRYVLAGVLPVRAA